MFLYKAGFQGIDYIMYLYPPGVCKQKCMFCKAQDINRDIVTVFPSLSDKKQFYEEFRNELKNSVPGTVFLNGSGDFFSDDLDLDFQIKFLKIIIEEGYTINFISNSFQRIMDLSNSLTHRFIYGISICSGDQKINNAVLDKNAKTPFEIVDFIDNMKEEGLLFQPYLFVSPVIPFISYLNKIMDEVGSIFDKVYFENFIPSTSNLKKLEDSGIIDDAMMNKINSWYEEKKSYRKYFRHAMHSLKTKYKLKEIVVIQH
ncbi:hypothetical protein KAJ27_00795 [bacterium]|nr:hypothetical protein [bacterium]